MNKPFFPLCAKKCRTGVRVTMACIVNHKHKDLQDHEVPIVLLLWLQLVTQIIVLLLWLHGSGDLSSY